MEVNVSIGWLILGAASFSWLGAKLGVMWDRHWCDRLDYKQPRAEKEALYKLSQGAPHSVVQWQERAIMAEAKLKDVGEFAEYIDG